ncbi:hypothetical protein [Methylobacterium gnaphalii]|uniref:Uncharacterized protein n=1 Tax=Methylobacterium gnaphalii TaxID=1010610 RepID=A0A512JGD9_9HYPH|nr:hypothetical protein [Methylobacterium gnaphalii]GEP09025.1 hypothetical protein MGN01_08700 [Methylobacterium gnaphalii]GJD71534.1 hypothetical protein MMMDOFMJ_4496 [Methylobacterium gnaphalii]GLS48948.1 hypothetical protein GCM10007885_17950 [Methylobacterium gnaphalii]
MALTGRFWFRKTWTGKVVLMVEEKRPRWFGGKDAFSLRWRDASLIDFAESALKPLLALEHMHRAAALQATFSASRAPSPAKFDGGPPETLAA